MDIEEFKGPDGVIRRPGSLILPEGFVSSFPPYTGDAETPVWEDKDIKRVISDPNRRDITKVAPFEVYGTDQREHSCHDDQTEVLTETGWQLWKDYDHTAKLATVNPDTLRLEYQEPTHVYVGDYDGPMFVSRNKDFMVTPNHRMFVKKWSEKDRTLESQYSMVEIADLGWYSGLLAAPTYFEGVEVGEFTFNDGRTISGDDLVCLMALVVSDGWVGSGDTVKHQVSFCCFREEKREAVAALAARAGFGELPGRRGVWIRTDKAFAGWVRSQIYVEPPHRSWTKTLPRWVLNASTRQLLLFEEFYGDRSHTERCRAFYTSSPWLVDDLQELSLKLGLSSSVYTKPQGSVSCIRGREVVTRRPQYVVALKQEGKISISRKKELGTQHYAGKVYCATVPNGTLITRRNGYILVSGNSCNGWAGANAVTVRRVLMGINDGWVGSGAYVYSKINGGRDSGSLLEDGLVAIGKYGVASRSTVPYNKIYPSQYSKTADDEAKKNKGLQCYRVTTKQAFRTAIAAGWLGIVAVHVGNKFVNFRGTGVAPLANGIGNHAVLVTDMRLINGTENYIIDNSWNISWGNKGRCRLVWDHFAQTFNKHAFYVVPAVRSVT